MKNKICPILFIVLISCKPSTENAKEVMVVKNQQEAASFVKNDSETVDSLNQNKSATGYVLNNEFSANPFTFKIDTSKVNEVLGDKFHFNSQPYSNTHSSSDDKFLIYTSRNDTVIFYSTAKKVHFNTAILRSSTVELSKNIKVGMSKESFTKVFNIENKDAINKFVIEDEEGYSSHTFEFINDSLKSIHIYNEVD
ncbi:hypothetical protein [Reichenbachiella sp. MALMAid0571]|uniref:hypothetical protein n=1 Tax=Reichenbachiella sp. MALMAid0571 TaxID=3143939 RepID=UPI0032DEFD5E